MRIVINARGYELSISCLKKEPGPLVFVADKNGYTPDQVRQMWGALNGGT